jgi:hypothetical protein
MSEPDGLDHLLRAALPPVTPGEPGADLWPRIVERLDTRPPVSWVDLSLVALVALTLLMFPEGLFLLAYHL